jgi:hypothetical protein
MRGWEEGGRKKRAPMFLYLKNNKNNKFPCNFSSKIIKYCQLSATSRIARRKIKEKKWTICHFSHLFFPLHFLFSWFPKVTNIHSVVSIVSQISTCSCMCVCVCVCVGCYYFYKKWGLTLCTRLQFAFFCSCTSYPMLSTH